MAKPGYEIIIKPLSEEDGGGFVAFVPDLTGCLGDGATPKEALDDVMHAISSWTAAQKRAKRKMPVPGSALARKAAARGKTGSGNFWLDLDEPPKPARVKRAA
ncbi:MAG TPA: type II toxin-antitoxin system HicB family antitoxin [Micropepsaceae bacterium]|nr:type II toxin-antitoxin system HicB family antitoxin [Micropepsaceae bacterium]